LRNYDNIFGSSITDRVMLCLSKSDPKNKGDIRSVMATQNQIIEQLKILQILYSRGEVSEVVERSLPKIIAHEIAIAQQQAREIEADLQEYEIRYQMPSAEFYHKFRAGELGDDVDFVEWSSFYQMWSSVRERLQILLSNS
jgi:hypothetical protein